MDKKIKSITTAAIIAAVYISLTFASSAIGLGYGQIQLRLSEAMCVLAAFTPAAIPGLTLGCAIANLASPLGLVDIICGSLATLLAAVCTYALRNVKFKGIAWLVPLPSVVFNALIVGAELTALIDPSQASLAVFAANAFWVAAGQFIACYVIGIPLYVGVDRCAPLKKLISE